MNRKHLRFIGSCLAVGLVAALALVMASCSSNSTSTSSTLSSIAVVPKYVLLANGATQQFNAAANYGNDTVADITSSATWASSNPAFATVSSSGLVTQLASTGTTSITASLNGVTSNSVTLSSTPVLFDIALSETGTLSGMPVGSTQQFSATGDYADGSTGNITSQVTWTSSNPAAATISSSGLL